jgi:hypothetical protein
MPRIAAARFLTLPQPCERCHRDALLNLIEGHSYLYCDLILLICADRRFGLRVIVDDRVANR